MIKTQNFARRWNYIKNDVMQGFAELHDKEKVVNGYFVNKVEEELKKLSSRKYALLMHSGSHAITMSIKAHNIQHDQEVIVPNYSCPASLSSVALAGCTPSFCEIDQYGMIDADKLNECLTDKTKAILFVDLYGQTPDIDKIKEFAKQFNIIVIEDAAQSFGASYKDKKVGNLVDLTCFSFNPVKPLGAMGDAGAVTGSKELIDKVRMYRDHGRKSKFVYEDVGYNARIDNLQAMILKTKLKKIDEWNAKKKLICQKYTEQLKDIVKTPLETPWSDHVYYAYVIETPPGTRDDLQKFLKEKGIATNIHYKFPTHTAKPFAKYTSSLPRTEYVCNNILSLPCYFSLPKQWQDYIINAIKEFYAKY